MGGWCGREEGGKTCGGVCACEEKGLHCVVSTVIVSVGECDKSVRRTGEGERRCTWNKRVFVCGCGRDPRAVVVQGKDLKVDVSVTIL